MTITDKTHMALDSANELVKIARALDATYLVPEQSSTELINFAELSASVGAYGLCVFPKQAMLINQIDKADSLQKVCVVGFPHGANLIGAKAWEGTLLANQVDEFDYVPDLDAILNKRWQDLAAELNRFTTASRSTRRAHKLKVILETSLLEADLISEAVRVAVDCGYDFVKTSTGTHPSGGASLQAVETMVRAGNDEIKVKASGGIRTIEDALRYLEAGATRLGSTQLVFQLAGDQSSESSY